MIGPFHAQNESFLPSWRVIQHAIVWDEEGAVVEDTNLHASAEIFLYIIINLDE